MHSTLTRRALARVWSSWVCVVVILVERAERAFSKEAGEDWSFCEALSVSYLAPNKSSALIMIGSSDRSSGCAEDCKVLYLRPMAKIKP